jgi:hypothetical protein
MARHDIGPMTRHYKENRITFHYSSYQNGDSYKNLKDIWEQFKGLNKYPNLEFGEINYAYVPFVDYAIEGIPTVILEIDGKVLDYTKSLEYSNGFTIESINEFVMKIIDKDGK